MLHGFQGVRRKKRIKQFFIWAIFISITFLVLEGVWSQHKKNKLVKKTYEEVRFEMATLIERQNEIKKQVDMLSTQRGIEEELRTKFHVALPGEKTVVIVDAKKENGEDKENENIWRKIKIFFGMDG